MAIFSNTTEEEMKADKKSDKVSGAKKTASKTAKKESSSMKDLYTETGAAKKETAAKAGEVKKQTGNAYKILIKPLVTEKAASLNVEGKYVFEVSTEANKIEVAKAVSEVYGIKPLDVNIVSVKGKRVRRGRIAGKRKDWKKAIVTLPKGKSINIYEGV